MKRPKQKLKEWLCVTCWRSGEFPFGAEPTMAEAIAQHRQDVERDKAAGKIPAGVDPKYAGAAWMDRIAYAGDCAGDLRIRAKPKPDVVVTPRQYALDDGQGAIVPERQKVIFRRK